jgi:hypothetical protein
LVDGETDAASRALTDSIAAAARLKSDGDCGGSILWVRGAVTRRVLASLDPSAEAEDGLSQDTERTYVAD